MSISKTRPTYNREQLTLWAQKINRDPSYQLSTLEAEIKTNPLKALHDIQRKQLGLNHWGNIALHYSWHRQLSLEPEELFKKIVERGLGGYCMENNELFAAILRSLGYDLYYTGARIGEGLDSMDPNAKGFHGWQHEVIILTLNGEKYLVDLGLGNSGPIEPVVLKDGATARGVPGVQVRLSYGPIDILTSGQQMWVLQAYNDSVKGWYSCYNFVELEWIPEDFAIINYRTSKDPKSWFTHIFVMSKYLLDDKLENIIGTLSIVGPQVSRRVGGGKSEKLLTCTKEEERIEALEKYFDIVLLPEERRGITGTATAIKKNM